MNFVALFILVMSKSLESSKSFFRNTYFSVTAIVWIDMLPPVRVGRDQRDGKKRKEIEVQSVVCFGIGFLRGIGIFVRIRRCAGI